MRIGILHPGEMGAAVGALLRQRGHDVLWAGEGRSRATAARAGDADLTGTGGVAELAARSDTILSICPPHAALDVARSVAAAGFAGTYVDANAVSPATATAVADLVRGAGATAVDGGIVGGPPAGTVRSRLYLSGPAADGVAGLFTGTALTPRVVDDRIGSASAVKMTYAGWTKCTSALLLALWATAEAEGVSGTLAAEWRDSQPALFDRLTAARESAAAKGWRWIGEMEEIADTVGAAGFPEGFHRAAADVFRRYG